jgi:membrane protein implicated in regulation of membrane protease activity
VPIVNLLEWVREHLWESWLGLSLVLVGAEMFSLDLVLLMLAGGAFVGMVVALLGGPFELQVVVALVAAVTALTLVRPSIVSRLHSGPELQLGPTKLIGQRGVVIQQLSAMDPGRVRLAGEVWTAEPYDDTATILEGAEVEVLEIRGATAYVHPLPALDPPVLG